jgi:endonuclease/exonuclease/phosphatase family metal-dependent hydrolase
MIWFYPLNELELSGYEAVAIVLFSPLLFGIPFVRRLVSSQWAVALLRLLSVASLFSFQSSTTLSRLVILAVGCFCIMLVLATTIFSASHNQRSLTLWGLVLGLLAFVSSRIWFTSFVPAWWDNTSNSVVITLSAIATIDKIMSGDDYSSSDGKSQLVPFRANWLFVGVGFGSLLYLTHAVFGDVSLISRWAISGYPSTGPMPYPWGATVLLALWFGVLLSPCYHVTKSLVWWLIGSSAFAALYLLPTWQAFTGGILLAVYTTSVWPAMLDYVSVCPPGRTLCLAMLTWLAETLFSVWTVAYNFVPGGEYTREHTGWLIVVVVVTIGLATLTAGQESHSKSYSAFIEVDKRGKMPDGKTNFLLLLILMSGLCGFVARYPKQTFTHEPKVHPRADFSAAIWTYHFGYDNVGWPSLERSAVLLNNTGADVITLLESDASKPFLGNNDLAMWLAERLKMYVDFGPSTRDHTWGNLILSKYPFVKSTHHLLPSPHGELAPAVTATINMTGHLVDFVVTHMGNDRDVVDRDLQAKFLARELANAKNPVVFLGYVTSAPFSRDYNRLTQFGKVNDIDNTDTDRWCEYIMYRSLIRLGYARISHGGLSDTEIQLARFRIPEDYSNFTDNKQIVTDPKHVDTDVHFTTHFGGYRVGHNWLMAHHYHMSTPKYFVP